MAGGGYREWDRLADVSLWKEVFREAKRHTMSPPPGGFGSSIIRSDSRLENPFGADANDLDVHDMQHDMNNRLLLLLDPISAIIPTLSGNQVQDHVPWQDGPPNGW